MFIFFFMCRNVFTHLQFKHYQHSHHSGKALCKLAFIVIVKKRLSIPGPFTQQYLLVQLGQIHLHLFVQSIRASGAVGDRAGWHPAQCPVPRTASQPDSRWGVCLRAAGHQEQEAALPGLPALLLLQPAELLHSAQHWGPRQVLVLAHLFCLILAKRTKSERTRLLTGLISQFKRILFQNRKCFSFSARVKLFECTVKDYKVLHFH